MPSAACSTVRLSGRRCALDRLARKLRPQLELAAGEIIRDRDSRARPRHRSRSPRCRRGHSRQAPAPSPADCGPTRRPPATSSHAIEPPPEPIELTSTMPTRTGIAVDQAFRAQRRRAVLDQRDVAGGAADIDRDQVAHAGGLGRHLGRRSRRPRVRRETGAPDAAARVRDAGNAAARLHDLQRRRHARRCEARCRDWRDSGRPPASRRRRRR